MAEFVCEHPRCGYPLPLGGVMDDVGRRAHYFCAQLRKLEVAAAAQSTAREIAAHAGRPKARTSLPLSDTAA